MPGPNRYFSTSQVDTTEILKQQYKQEAEWLKNNRLNPDYIERA